MLTALKKFLYITSLFPPLGGSGVQRQLYYVCLSRQFGWEPVVLTVKEVVYHDHDESLLSKIPPGVQVERTESLEFGRILWKIHMLFSKLRRQHTNDMNHFKLNSSLLNAGRAIRDWFTIVDDRVLWIPFAFRRALRVIKASGIDVVVARGGPMSNTIAGYLISLATHKPFVLDLADPWLEFPYAKFPTSFHYWINQTLERKVFQFASKITVASPQIKRDLHRKYPKFRDEDIQVVTNGFDPSQFACAPTFRKEKRFVIAHVGTLKWYRRQAFTTFLRALNSLIKENPQYESIIEFKHVGAFDDEIQGLLASMGLLNITRLIGYCPHIEAMGHMKAADLLFLPISDEMTNKNGVFVIPGKLFEYIGSKTPILMIGPETSDTYAMINDDELGFAFSNEQAEEVKECLKSLIEAGRDKFSNLQDTEAFSLKISKFERQTLAHKFIDTLDQAIRVNN